MNTTHNHPNSIPLIQYTHLLTRLIAVLVLLLLILAVPASAQRFKKGYVVSAEGDTTRYAIDLNGAVSGGTAIVVRDGPLTRQLSAKKVRAFGFEGGAAFESSTFFPIAQQEGASLEQEILVNHVFYQRLVKGVISLYKYTNKYIVMTEDQMLELRYDHESQDVRNTVFYGGQRSSNNQRYTKINAFRDILKELFVECPEVAEQADKTDLNDASLKRIFVAYSNCKGVSVQVAQKSGGLQVSGSVALGYYSVKPKFNIDISNTRSAINDVDFKAQSGITPSASLYLTLPKFIPNLYLRLGFNHMQFETQERFVDVQTTTSTVDTVNLQLKFTSLNLGLQYELEKGSYAVVGTGFTYFSESAVSEERTVTTTTTNPPTVSNRSFSPFRISSGAPVIFFGVGQRFSLGEKLGMFAELRYTRISGFDDRESANRQFVTSRITGLQVFLGLRI